MVTKNKNKKTDAVKKTSNKDIKKKTTNAELETNVFIREVNEDLQSEKMQKFFKKYYKKIIVVIAAILLIAASVLIYQSQKRTATLKESLTFQKTIKVVDTELKAKKFENAEKALKDFIATARFDYKDIAYSVLFDLYNKSGKKEKIVGLLEEVKKEANTDFMKDFAVFNLAVYKFNKKEISTDKLTKDLKPLMRGKTPFKYSAYIVVITAYAEEGSVKKANKYIAKFEKEFKGKNAEEIQAIKKKVKTLKKLVASQSNKK